MRDTTIKTARRVFEILEMFHELQRPLSLKEITERYKYPASSASTLLKSFVVLGYLHYDHSEKSYFPTMSVQHLGKWIGDAFLGNAELVGLLDGLNHKTQETITLGVQSDLFIQYVHVIQSTLPVRFYIPPGRIFPITRSGMGWLFLSLRPDEVIDQLVRRANAAEKAAGDRVKLAHIMERVHKIRSEGFVHSENVTAQGGAMIAMELPERKFGRTLLVGVHGTLQRIRDNKSAIVAEMKASIRRLANTSGKNIGGVAAKRSPTRSRKR